MSEESNMVEALLFSSGRKMGEGELSKITRLKPEKLKQALEELKRKYESEESPLILFNEGDSWKLTTKEKYLGLVQNIVTETELDKSLMETLAVIAWKYPILQADVIKLRNNKAYEHLRELEEAGFIAREKKGRTKTIKLTPKFFEYFDLPPSKAKTREAFKEVVPEEIRDCVEKTEHEIQATEEQIEEVRKKKEELEQKIREEKEKKKTEQEVDIVDEFGKKTKLDVYESKEEEPKPEKHKLGHMEIYGEGEAEVTAAGEPKISETAAEKRAKEVEKEEITPEVEAEIEKMIHPKTEPEKPSFEEAEKPEEEEKPAEEAKQEEAEVEKEEEELMPEEKEEEEGEIEEEPEEKEKSKEKKPEEE